MTGPARVRVVYFPKRCPTCGGQLRVVHKFSGAWWFECETCVAVDESADSCAPADDSGA